MGRPAKNKALPRKPAAKANKPPEQSGTGGKSAKKKTSTRGIRVALQAPHVAAEKPTAPATALAVSDRAVPITRVPYTSACAHAHK